MLIVDSESFNGLMTVVADCVRRSWAAEDAMNKAHADIDGMDAVIIAAGHDPHEVVTKAYELAQETYKPAEA